MVRGQDPEFAQTVHDGKVVYVSIVSAPAEPVENQGFQIIGPLSHMYSKYLEVRTTDDQGEPSALDIQATPSLIASFLSPHPKDRQFKTWQLEVRASDAEVRIGQDEETSPD